MQLGESQYIFIGRNEVFECSGPKTITTSLLRVNKQIHKKAEDVLFSVNRFLLCLGNLSCMGEPQPSSSPEYFSVPATWSSKLRSRIYQMQHLHVIVQTGAESANHEMINKTLETETIEDAVKSTREERKENLLIVQTAVDELCNVLELSNRLRSIDMHLWDIGHPSLTTGQEHRVLKPFGKLKNLHNVEVTQVPFDFARALKESMKRKRNQDTDGPGYLADV